MTDVKSATESREYWFTRGYNDERTGRTSTVPKEYEDEYNYGINMYCIHEGLIYGRKENREG